MSDGMGGWGGLCGFCLRPLVLLLNAEFLPTRSFYTATAVYVVKKYAY